MVELHATLSSGASTTLDSSAIDDLRLGMQGPILLPDDAGYDEVRELWNGKMHDKRPAVIARCNGVADVIDAVNFARANNLLVAVRGGGHNVAGSASCDGGIMIDLSLMNSVHVNPKTRTVLAQGGATWGDVDRETQVHGLVVPGGVISTTGIAGLTLGGGLGWLRRKHGLTIDNLLSVEMVTADGKVVIASEKENPDLFWGVRGGGGNFGIVTTFEYRAHPVGPMIMFAGPWYPAEDAEEILPKWREFMKSAPEELSSQAMFWSVPADPHFPAETHGRRALILTAVYCGSVEEGEKVLQPLREMGKPLFDLSSLMPWTTLQTAFDPFFPKGQRHYYFKSRYLSDLSADTINALMPNAINPPVPSVLVVLWHYGGAMSRVPKDATAFMGRDAAYLFSVDAIWDDPRDTDPVLAYSRAFLSKMEPHSPGGLYVNFAGFGEEGNALVRAAYGAHYDRLVALKTKYDPSNLFRLNQNIKPRD